MKLKIVCTVVRNQWKYRRVCGGMCDQSDLLQVGFLGTLGPLQQMGKVHHLRKIAAVCPHGYKVKTKERQIRKSDVPRYQGSLCIFQFCTQLTKAWNVLQLVVDWFYYVFAHNQFSYTNSNVGTHNIVIDSTLGWSKQQYCQYSPDAERRMQGKVAPYSLVYPPVVNWLCKSVDNLSRMFWRTWSLLP